MVESAVWRNRGERLPAGGRRLLSNWADGEGAGGVRTSVSARATVLQLSYVDRVSYDVIHPAGRILDPSDDSLAASLGTQKVMFVLDENVDRLYGPEFDRYVALRIPSAHKFVMQASEPCKTLASVESLIEQAVRCELPRHGLIAAVGGGVVLDTAGLAASLYRRGVGYVRVPTTLIGIIDVGVGIKQAVNHLNKKSLIGSFYPPSLTINDCSFLRTLPRREIACGTAEIIKIALVRGASLFELLEKYGTELTETNYQTPASIAREVILESERLMMEELRPNLFETHFKRLVDFGHTFSPHLEEITGYRVAHGEAVAADMLLSIAIAVQEGICDRSLLHRLERLYAEMSVPRITFPSSVDDLLGCIRSVRRSRGGTLNLVLPERPGKAIFVNRVSRACLKAALASLDRAPGQHAER